KMLSTVGTRGMHGNPSLSPDGTRVAFSKADLEKEVNDLWVMDLSGGSPKQLTVGKSREFVTSAPVWSPNGSQLAYTALRDGTFSIYRRSVSGEGSEEVVYKLPGITAVTDWSQDGRFLALSSTDLGGGILSALPMTGSGEKKLIEVFKSPKQLQGG